MLSWRKFAFLQRFKLQSQLLVYPLIFSQMFALNHSTPPGFVPFVTSQCLQETWLVWSFKGKSLLTFIIFFSVPTISEEAFSNFAITWALFWELFTQALLTELFVLFPEGMMTFENLLCRSGVLIFDSYRVSISFLDSDPSHPSLRQTSGEFLL